jgi:hypothetical protein
LTAAICALVAGLVMSVLARIMAICPFEPPLLAKQCAEEVSSIAIRASVDGAWKGALFGTAIAAMIVYWKLRKS